MKGVQVKFRYWSQFQKASLIVLLSWYTSIVSITICSQQVFIRNNLQGVFGEGLPLDITGCVGLSLAISRDHFGSVMASATCKSIDFLRRFSKQNKHVFFGHTSAGSCSSHMFAYLCILCIKYSCIGLFISHLHLGDFGWPLASISYDVHVVNRGPAIP